MALLRRSGRLWPTLLAPLAGAALVSAWWFVRNWLLYQELLPGKIVAAAKAAAGGNTLFVPVDAGFNLLTLSTETNFWQITLQSFVAGLGLLDIFLPSGWYLVCAALGLLAAIGLVFGLRRAPPGRAGWMLLLASAVALAGTTLSAMVISLHGEYAPHGRYFFPMLIPLAIGLSAGWTWLADAQKILSWVPITAVAFLMVLNATSLLGYVVPAYYGPGSESFTVQIDRPAQPQAAEDAIEVSGWAFIEGGRPWRPYAADVVAGYRRPVFGPAVYVVGPSERGRFLGLAEYGLPRRDVSQLYGGVTELEPVGYRLLLPPGSVPPGEHRVYVCVDPWAPPTCSSRPFSVL
jgi:hypothetical protein